MNMLTKILLFPLKLPLVLSFGGMLLFGLLSLGWAGVQNTDWDALKSLEPYKNKPLLSQQEIETLPKDTQSLLFVAQEKSYQAVHAYVISHEKNTGRYRLIAFWAFTALFFLSVLQRFLSRSCTKNKSH